MKEEDKKAFLILMAMMSEALKEDMSSERGKIYFEFLKKYSIAEVTYGVKQSIRTLKWFPKISEIINFINPDEHYEFVGDPKMLKHRNEKENKEALDYIKRMAMVIGDKKAINPIRLPHKEA